jgi:hypothetical protein
MCCRNVDCCFVRCFPAPLLRALPYSLNFLKSLNFFPQFSVWLFTFSFSFCRCNVLIALEENLRRKHCDRSPNPQPNVALFRAPLLDTHPEEPWRATTERSRCSHRMAISSKWSTLWRQCGREMQQLGCEVPTPLFWAWRRNPPRSCKMPGKPPLSWLLRIFALDDLETLIRAD